MKLKLISISVIIIALISCDLITGYDVVYLGNGADSGDPPNTQSYPSGAEIVIAGQNTLTRLDYTFGGWGTAIDGSGTLYQPGDIFSMGSVSITLYAQWISNIPADGLIAYYPFNGNAEDETANDYHGSVVGAEPTADRFGNAASAYLFTGDDYIELSDMMIQDAPFSISMWFKTASSTHGQTLIANYLAYSYEGWGFYISLWNSLPTYPEQIELWSGLVKHETQFYDNNWHHVGATVDDTGYSLYYDGNLIGKTSVLYETSLFPQPLLIGVSKYIGPPGFIHYFEGLIDDVRIYGRTLEQSEIGALYHEAGFAN